MSHFQSSSLLTENVALSGLFIYLSNSYLSYGVVNEWLMLVNKLQIFIADYVLFFNRIIVSLRRMKNHEPIDDMGSGTTRIAIAQ